MAKTGNSRQDATTHVAQAPQGGIAQSAVVPSVPRKVETGASLGPMGRTVPSSLTTGSVWLRCSVGQAGKNSHEASTQV